MRTTTSALRAAVIGDAALALEEGGIDSSQHDAEVLAAHALGLPRSALPRAPMFSGQQFETFRSLIARRAKREPLQYILGSAAFRHIEVLVGPGAFIPRPETELLAGWVIDALRDHAGPVVIDLCSGPGTIALAIAHELPRARVYAVERDPVAAGWAKRNIEATGLNVTLAVADMWDAFPDSWGQFDAVVANPPYLVRGSVEQPEVRDHEPADALYDEGDGLCTIRDLPVMGKRFLRAGGLLAVEHGDNQGRDTVGYLRANGFVDVQDHPDLNGRDRFTTARKP